MLRILEGDVIMDSNRMSIPGYDVGSRSGRIWSDYQLPHERHSGPMLNEALEGFNSKLSLSTRSNFSERDKARTSYKDDL